MEKRNYRLLAEWYLQIYSYHEEGISVDGQLRVKKRKQVFMHFKEQNYLPVKHLKFLYAPY